MKNFVQKGDTVTCLAPYAVLSGGGCLATTLFGVACSDALITAPVELNTKGVYDLSKDASTFADKDNVYWDNTALLATSTPNGNQHIGVAQTVNADGSLALGGVTGDATVRVRLNGIAGDGISLRTVVILTAAQIIAMGTTAIQILPAPGVGKAIVVDSILFEITTTSTQFTGGGVTTFVYHGGAVAVHAGSIPAATVTAVAGSTNTLLGPAVLANGTVVPANTAVDITNATAAFAAGTGTAKVQIRYRILGL